MHLLVIETIQIGRPLLPSFEFEAWFFALPFQKQPLDDLHITIAYSKTPVDWKLNVFCPVIDDVLVTGGHREIRQLNGGAIALTFESEELSGRWQEIVSSGASWDFAEYVPHVTLGFGGLVRDGRVTVYEGPLFFDREYRKTTRSQVGEPASCSKMS